MSAVRHPIPGEKPDIVKVPSPQELARAITHQLALIDKHKAMRPSNTDIPALTTWAQAHALLTFDLELLQGQAATAAKDVPFPQPKPLIVETPVNDPKQTLQDILAEIKDVTARAGHAFDRPTFRVLYQRVNNLRHKAREIAKKHDLGDPEFPVLPVNPFAEPAPMPTLAALVEEESAERAQTLQSVVDAEPMEKAGPGPYEPPTTEGLRALLPPPCGGLTAADMDQRDRQPIIPSEKPRSELDILFPYPEPRPDPTAWEIASSIRTNFWPLCQAIEEMDDREAIRRALDSIHARLQTAYALLEEEVVGKGAVA